NSPRNPDVSAPESFGSATYHSWRRPIQGRRANVDAARGMTRHSGQGDQQYNRQFCVAHPQANGRGEVTRALGDFFVQPFKGLLHTGVPAECCTLFTTGRAPVDDPDGLSVAISFEQDPITAHD